MLPETWTSMNVGRLKRRWVLDRSFPWVPRRRLVREELMARDLFRPIHSGHSPANWVRQTRWRRKSA